MTDHAGAPRPHDLLWGLGAEQLPDSAPAWALEALRQQPPVVVRRAVAAPGWVAVGVRGQSRDQRFATWMRLGDIRRRLSPERLASARGWHDHPHSHWPALRALSLLQAPLDGCGLAWGVTGSIGFELASGLAAAHAGSDLDLVLRTPAPLSRQRAGQLCALFGDLPGKVDVQLETPHGAVALREWASGATRVLLKAQDGPRLVADPWAPLGSPA
ncbi:malonate decarboxylase holo-ACP synthase [Pseudomonas benzenivorans]|uniref:Phosphoribosyl-dephospho-CoA transferase n=1 Tax=Pseudomonas benzenivorans TaxID=556533 RepID=A0ABY5H6A6_9PSED|nr:malonate decarboxylase holo-ACP synthase [Pseudomonas benzenivorans]UTW06947.1 malonate decarboxylase holo-ACP synthase [Pseudomonas benzenivorans]